MPACRNRDGRGKVVNLVLFAEKMQANAFSIPARARSRKWPRWFSWLLARGMPGR